MASRIAVMNKGVLQQIDSPQNLYDRPNNLFVAGFIGSPAMNFFKSTMKKSDGKICVDGGSFCVEIPESRFSLYEPLRRASGNFRHPSRRYQRPEFRSSGYFCPAG